MHVRQVQIEQYDIIIIELTKIEAFFPQIGRVNIEPLIIEHQFNGLGRCWFIFDQQYAHGLKPLC